MQVPFQLFALSLVLPQLGGSVTLGAHNEMEHLATRAGDRNLANLSKSESRKTCDTGSFVCVTVGAVGNSADDCEVHITDGCFAGPFSVDWEMTMRAVGEDKALDKSKCLYHYKGEALTLKGGRTYNKAELKTDGKVKSIFVPGTSEAKDHFGCTIRIADGKRPVPVAQEPSKESEPANTLSLPRNLVQTGANKNEFGTN